MVKSKYTNLRLILAASLSVFVLGARTAKKAPEEVTDPSETTPVDDTTPPPSAPTDPDAGTTLSYNTIPNLVTDTTMTDASPVSSDISKLSQFKSVPNLPNGLLINATTGVISGKPTGLWTPQTYTISAKTAAGTVISTPVSISVFADAGATSVDPALPHNAGYERTEMIAYVGVPIAENHFSAQTASAIVNYEFVGTAAMYAGVSIDGDGTLGGTPFNTLPRTAQKISYRTQVNGVYTSYEIVVYITILSGPPTITYNHASYSTTQGNSFGTVTATLGGGTATSLSISPALPAGVQFNTFTGAITGQTTALKSLTTYTVTASNGAGSGTATFTMEVTLPAPDDIVYKFPSKRYTVGAEAAVNSPTVRDYGIPSSYSVSPTLPAGLSINTSTGAITGTPTTLQSDATYTVTASNSTGSKNIALTISVVNPGTHVLYATNGSQIKAYAADPVTGEPAYLGKLLNSPITGRLAFHQTQDCAFGISSSEVYALSINKSDYGALSVINSMNGINNARNLALHSSGNYLYVIGGDSVYVYAVNASTCALSSVATTSAGVGGIVDGAVTGDNLYVFTGGAQIKHFAINSSSGAVTGNATVEMSLHGNPPQIPQMHGAGLYLVANGNHVYAYDDARAIESFEVNATTGALTSLNVNFDAGTYYFGRPALDATHDRLFTPFNAASWSGLVYTVLNADGTCGNGGSILASSILTGFTIARTADIHVSDSGSYIYTSSEYVGAKAYARLKVNADGTLTAAGAGLEGTISGY